MSLDKRKYNGGFSLVEIMISVGAIGLVSLGVLNLSKLQSGIVTGNKGGIDLTKQTIALYGFLRDSKSCEKNFIGAKVGSGVTFNLLESESLNADGSPAQVFEVDKPFLSNTYQISKIELGDYNNDLKKASLFVTFDLIKKSAKATKSIVRELYLNVNLDASNDITSLSLIHI